LPNEVDREIAGIFEAASSSLGPKVAVLSRRELANRGPDPWLVLELTPVNPKAAPVSAVLLGELVFSIGRNGCRVEFGDILHSGSVSDEAEVAAIETTRQVVEAAVNGEYYEKVQQLPGIGAVSVTGFLRLGGRTIDFGRGLTIPFLKTVVQTYEPYRQ